MCVWASERSNECLFFTLYLSTCFFFCLVFSELYVFYGLYFCFFFLSSFVCYLLHSITSTDKFQINFMVYVQLCAAIRPNRNCCRMHIDSYGSIGLTLPLLLLLLLLWPSCCLHFVFKLNLLFALLAHRCSFSCTPSDAIWPETNRNSYEWFLCSHSFFTIQFIHLPIFDVWQFCHLSLCHN